MSSSRRLLDTKRDEGTTVVKMSRKAKQQLFILAICRFAEPAVLTSVHPYLYFMVKSFGIPEHDIGFWVGVISASYSFSQFTSGIWWGRASDRFGRKYTILVGLCGTFLSLLVFGFATSLPMAIAARCMAGLLNGNVGIMRTVVAEIVPQKELQPIAFSLMPLVWAIGSVYAPVIGGYLSDPVTNYPDYFSPGGFFSKYPYVLPNLFIAFLIIIGTTAGFLFLEESLESQKYKRDIGCEIGQKLVSIFTRKTTNRRKTLEDENSPLLTQSDEEQAFLNTHKTSPVPQTYDVPPFKEVLTPLAILNILVYTFLCLHSMGFDQLIPVNLAHPRDLIRDPHNPLRFFGGFGLSTPEIGFFFSIFGIFAMLNQFFIFPPVVLKYGVLSSMKFCVGVFPIIYLVAPFTVLVPDKGQKVAIFIIIFLKTMTAVFAFPASTILLTNSAPSLRLLGTLNGIATATAALGRGLGPIIGGTAFSYGQRVNYLILPWWLIFLLAAAAGVPTWWLVEGKGWEEEVKDNAGAQSAEDNIVHDSERLGILDEQCLEDDDDDSQWIDEEENQHS